MQYWGWNQELHSVLQASCWLPLRSGVGLDVTCSGLSSCAWSCHVPCARIKLLLGGHFFSFPSDALTLLWVLRDLNHVICYLWSLRETQSLVTCCVLSGDSWLLLLDEIPPVSLSCMIVLHCLLKSSCFPPPLPQNLASVLGFFYKYGFHRNSLVYSQELNLVRNKT